MKFENGHHVNTQCLSFEQYYRFRKKAANQGINPIDFTINYWNQFEHIGIKDGYLFIGDSYFAEHPDKLLTIDQALSDREEQPMNKVRIIEIEEQPKFKPFKLEITIESEEDLINLWHRMDLYNKEVGSFYSSGRSKLIKSKTNWEQSRIEADVWQILDKKAKELGLRK